MAKYTIPLKVTVYTEIEANNLKEALEDLCKGTPDVKGVDLNNVSEWEVDQWEYFYKNDELVADKEGNTYIGDFVNEESI